MAHGKNKISSFPRKHDNQLKAFEIKKTHTHNKLSASADARLVFQTTLVKKGVGLGRVVREVR
jgi:hypothetical protein